jgi:hypothetical protein
MGAHGTDQQFAAREREREPAARSSRELSRCSSFFQIFSLSIVSLSHIHTYTHSRALSLSSAIPYIRQTRSEPQPIEKNYMNVGLLLFVLSLFNAHHSDTHTHSLYSLHTHTHTPFPSPSVQLWIFGCERKRKRRCHIILRHATDRLAADFSSAVFFLPRPIPSPARTRTTLCKTACAASYLLLCRKGEKTTTERLLTISQLGNETVLHVFLHQCLSYSRRRSPFLSLHHSADAALGRYEEE